MNELQPQSFQNLPLCPFAPLPPTILNKAISFVQHHPDITNFARISFHMLYASGIVNAIVSQNRQIVALASGAAMLTELTYQYIKKNAETETLLLLEPLDEENGVDQCLNKWSISNDRKAKVLAKSSYNSIKCECDLSDSQAKIQKGLSFWFISSDTRGELLRQLSHIRFIEKKYSEAAEISKQGLSLTRINNSTKTCLLQTFIKSLLKINNSSDNKDLKDVIELLKAVGEDVGMSKEVCIHLCILQTFLKCHYLAEHSLNSFIKLDNICSDLKYDLHLMLAKYLYDEAMSLKKFSDKELIDREIDLQTKGLKKELLEVDDNILKVIRSNKVISTKDHFEDILLVLSTGTLDYSDFKKINHKNIKKMNPEDFEKFSEYEQLASRGRPRKKTVISSEITVEREPEWIRVKTTKNLLEEVITGLNKCLEFAPNDQYKPPILFEISKIYIFLEKTHDAEEAAKTGLKIQEKLARSSSSLQLFNFELNIELCLIICECLLDRDKPDLALTYIEKNYDLQLINTKDLRTRYFLMKGKVLSALGESTKAQEAFRMGMDSEEISLKTRKATHTEIPAEKLKNCQDQPLPKFNTFSREKTAQTSPEVGDKRSKIHGNSTVDDFIIPSANSSAGIAAYINLIQEFYDSNNFIHGDKIVLKGLEQLKNDPNICGYLRAILTESLTIQNKLLEAENTSKGFVGKVIDQMKPHELLWKYSKNTMWSDFKPLTITNNSYKIYQYVAYHNLQFAKGSHFIINESVFQAGIELSDISVDAKAALHDLYSNYCLYRHMYKRAEEVVSQGLNLRGVSRNQKLKLELTHVKILIKLKKFEDAEYLVENLPEFIQLKKGVSSNLKLSYNKISSSLSLCKGNPLNALEKLEENQSALNISNESLVIFSNYLIAKIKIKQDKLQEAENIIQESLKLTDLSKRTKAKLNGLFALLLRKQNKFLEAHKYIEEGIQLANGELARHLHRLKAEIYLDQKDLTSAKSSLEKAIYFDGCSMAPLKPTTTIKGSILLAKVLVSEDNFSKAKECLEKYSWMFKEKEIPMSLQMEFNELLRSINDKISKKWQKF